MKVWINLDNVNLFKVHKHYVEVRAGKDVVNIPVDEFDKEIRPYLENDFNVKRLFVLVNGYGERE